MTGGPRADPATLRKDGDAVSKLVCHGLYTGVLNGVRYYLQDDGSRTTHEHAPWLAVARGRLLTSKHETKKDVESEVVWLAMEGEL